MRKATEAPARRAAELAVRLLGPVRVVRGEEELQLGGPLPRGAVAQLALHAGTPLTHEALAGALWGDDPPPSARTTLAAHLSRLRRRGLSTLLRHSGGGYLLDVDRDAIDAHRAAQLHAQARRILDERPERAVALLDAALAMWHGEPLAGLDALPFVAGERARLRAAKLSLQLDRFDALLGAGRGAAITEELEALTAAHPLHERLWATRLRALHAAGRRADALDEYRALSDRMRTELGLDPGQPLVALQRALLRGDLEARGRDRVPVSMGGAVEPAELTAFTGRDDELTRLRHASRPGALVTVVGVSGMGKTRLVLEHVRTAAPPDVDGPYVVDLSAADDAVGVGTRVAHAVGLDAADASMGAIARALSRRGVWIVLDAVESVEAAAAEIVEALLRACPRVTAFATGLRPLGLASETVVQLGPLPAEGVDSDAVRLFRAATSRRGAGALGADDTDVVVSICRELDGMPLAIELAAAHVDHLPLRELAELLDDRLRILGTTGSTARSHHRTLMGAMTWSVALLSPRERQVLAATGVFVGGFVHEALVAVASVIDVDDGITDALEELRRRALVAGGVGVEGTARYRLLSSVRQYARSLLPTRRLADLEDAHARWAAEVAAEAAPGLRTRDHERWWHVLTVEQDNLRAALGHGLAGGDVELALATAADLAWYWYRHGDVDEGRAWLRRTLDAAPHARPATRARGLYGAALLAYLAGDVGAVAAHVGPALTLASEAGDEALHAVATSLDAYVAAATGDLGRAEHAVTALRLEGLPEWAAAEVDMVAGQLARAAGRRDAALQRLSRARETAARIGHYWAEGSSAWIAAKVLLDDQRPEDAADILLTALRHFSGTGERTGPLAVAHTLATAYAAMGLRERAATMLGAVDALGARLGYHPVRMDPQDAPRHRALVEQAMPPDALAEGRARGAGLDFEELIAMAVDWHPAAGGG